MLWFELLCLLNVSLHIIWSVCWLPFKISSRHHLVLLFNNLLGSYISLLGSKIIKITWITLEFSKSNFQLALRLKLMIFRNLRSNKCLVRQTITLKRTFWEYLILRVSYFLIFNPSVLPHVVHCIVWFSFKFASNF